MKAFILAAGKGERMRPLTAALPKPLLTVAGKTLLDHQIERLLAAGVDEIIINTAWLGELIEAHVEQHHYPCPVHLSREVEPLETGGALVHADALLGDKPFLLVNADVWCEADYRGFIARASRRLGERDCAAYLLLVANPDHHPGGDFVLREGRVQPIVHTSPASSASSDPTFTFSGISLLSPQLIRDYPQRRRTFPLREVFLWAMAQGRVAGEVSAELWMDIGTPQRLQALEQRLGQGSRVLD